MNFIQHWFDLPLGIVFKEDKAEYFEALIQTRKEENITVFRKFMYKQYEKYLQKEISAVEEMLNNNKGKGYSFLF